MPLKMVYLPGESMNEIQYEIVELFVLELIKLLDKSILLFVL